MICAISGAGAVRPPPTRASAMHGATMASRELEAALQALGHRSTGVRQTAALRVRQMYERSGSAAILRRLVEALSSAETTRRLGGLALVNELIDVNEWSRVGTGAGRFCRLLRAAVERATSPEELAIVVRTLGHAVRAAGSAATDPTDTELARALDWMSAPPEAPRASFHRLGACLIVTELAERGGPLAASAVASRLQRVTAAVWVSLCDEELETRQAAIGTLRACISIACQRDGGVAAWFESAIARALNALERHEAMHPSADGNTGGGTGGGTGAADGGGALAAGCVRRNGAVHTSAGGAADGGALEVGCAGAGGAGAARAVGGGAGGLWVCSPGGGDGLTDSRNDSRNDSRVCSRNDSRVSSSAQSSTESGAQSWLDSSAASRVDSRMDSRCESRIDSRCENRCESRVQSPPDSRLDSGRHSGEYSRAGDCCSGFVFTPNTGSDGGAVNVTASELHGCLLALSELLDVTTGCGAAHPDAGRSSRERAAADRATSQRTGIWPGLLHPSRTGIWPGLLSTSLSSLVGGGACSSAAASAMAGDVFFSTSPQHSPLSHAPQWGRTDALCVSAAEPETILEGGGQRAAVSELLTAAERRRVFELVWRLRHHESLHVRIAVLQVCRFSD
jgi:FKBP12-rapamycin complex-associated protein